MSVDTDNDTAEFAVETIRRWWYSMGKPFYIDAGSRNNTLRLNFSNSDEEQIEEGIKRLARCLERLLEKVHIIR